MNTHPIVSHDEWIAARKRFLDKEKQLTRLRDELSRERRELPWEAVDKDYVFETDQGRQTLAELFGRHGQLIVYHFMFAPEWEVGCKSCSFWADNFNGIIPHLDQRDVSLVAVSRAPLEKLQAQARKSSWTFRWVSSGDSDFNYDYNVSFRTQARDAGDVVYNYRPQKLQTPDYPGVSVFAKQDGRIYHTYSAFSRGIDILNVAYHYLDITPKGRDEDSLSFPMAWVRHRFAYGSAEA